MIKGFSKLSKSEKIELLTQMGLVNETDVVNLSQSEYGQTSHQQLIEGFSENVISNFHLPYSVAPNFLVNHTSYVVPMVTEESSVVAAASWSAQFWAKHGGFKAVVLGTEKIGQLFFEWGGTLSALENHTTAIQTYLLESISSITHNMQKRGGGITKMYFVNHVEVSENMFELRVSFETADSMGANFINTALEAMSGFLVTYLSQNVSGSDGEANVVMAILSNNTPNCLVQCTVEAPFSAFDSFDSNGDGKAFATTFKTAVDIALTDSYRAVTHNKGIFNGVSAVLLATANDFRAVEAAGHAFAAKNGKYASLSRATLTESQFRLELQIPLAVGTVGGLTKTHPMAAQSLKLLGNPDAKTLMMLIASAGLASNFAAIKALVSGGIQRGHMKMHLNNILLQLNASSEQMLSAKAYFNNRTVSVSAVRNFLEQNPNNNGNERK